MPIRKLLREEIPPDEAQFLTDVFEDCLTELGLVDREDRLVTIVAYRVMDMAQDHGHDGTALKSAVLNTFKSSPS